MIWVLTLGATPDGVVLAAGADGHAVANSQADFSHAVCPDCMTREYPELVRLKPDTTDPTEAAGEPAR